MTTANTHNAYAFNRTQVMEKFAQFWEGAPDGLFMVLSHDAATDSARAALDATCSRLGYACGVTYIYSVGEKLTSDDLRSVIEGFDPRALIIVDTTAAHACEAAYCEKVALGAAGRLFGRTTCAFSNLDTLIQTTEGKQKAWHTLKALPEFA